LNKCTNSDKS